MNTRDFLIRKNELQTVEIRETPQSALADGQVRLRVDKFALTSNNITYAAFGDAMNYWKFFPVATAGSTEATQGAGETAWGIVDPIRKGWGEEDMTEREFYAAGTWGPVAADQLLSVRGHNWRHPQPIT